MAGIGVLIKFIMLNLKLRARLELLLNTAPSLSTGPAAKSERADQVAEWIRLTEEKQEREQAKHEDSKGGQVGPLSDEAHKGGRGNEGGISAASRELGIEKTQAKRAVKIAGATPAAKSERHGPAISTAPSSKPTARPGRSRSRSG